MPTRNRKGVPPRSERDTDIARSDQIGRDRKLIKLYLTDGDFVRFVNKLEYYGLNKRSFFLIFLDAFINDDKIVSEWLKEERKKRKINRKQVEKQIDTEEEAEKKTISDFALNEEEIENIYDIIEEEFDI